ncbi:MAG: GSU3529 family protein [Desulfuromonadales bacterium]
MDVFERLACAVRQQNREGELPDFITPLLMRVAENPAEFADREELVATLLKYVEQYETWSEMCCEKVGYSLEDIHRTLDRMKVRY